MGGQIAGGFNNKTLLKSRKSESTADQQPVISAKPHEVQPTPGSPTGSNWPDLLDSGSRYTIIRSSGMTVLWGCRTARRVGLGNGRSPQPFALKPTVAENRSGCYTLVDNLYHSALFVGLGGNSRHGTQPQKPRGGKIGCRGGGLGRRNEDGGH